MSDISYFVAITIAAFMLLRVAFSLFKQHKRARRARSLGCKSPPAYPQPALDIFGLKATYHYAKAVKEARVLERIVEQFNRVTREQGFDVHTMTYHALGRRSVLTKDPENIRAVLAMHFDDFKISDVRITNLGALVGEGIFVSNGPRWAHHRALLRPCFTREHINNMQIHERLAKILMKLIPVRESGWTDEVDLAPLFSKYTLDHATEFLCGASANVMLDDLLGIGTSGKVFGENFDHAGTFCARRLKFRFAGFHWMHSPASFLKACRDCQEYIDEYVQLAIEKKIDAAQAGVEKGGEYIFSDELVKQTRDPVELRANLLNILMAGRDATASLLGYIFALLARNPRVFGKLRRTIIEDFGDTNRIKANIDFASLKGCRYLQHCLNEALRVTPIIPANSRIAAKDTTLPRGGGPDGKFPIYVPKGTQIVYLSYCTAHDPAWWGEDVHEFRPERFERRKYGFEHTPFSAGPRICIGQQVALTSAGFVVVKMLQRFDAIESMDPWLEIKQSVGLTSKSLNGCKVRLHEART